jgi:hypothetical protein
MSLMLTSEYDVIVLLLAIIIVFEALNIFIGLRRK